MFGNGFGNFGNGGFGSGDFESLARQYWNAWGEAMRQGAAGAGLPGAGFPGTSAPGWQQATQWWSQLMPGAQPDAMGAVHRFNQLASGWFGQMQQVAAQFAGQGGSAADIAKAWREALGADNANVNPFADLFRTMQSGGQESLDNWLEQAAPYIQALQSVAHGDSSRWLHVPTFGLAREHQERWQALLQAQQDYQQRNNDYNALMLQVMQQALSLFEDKLAEREEPGRQLTSARALFDLWIDAAEDAYAQAALSEPFREIYGALTNAQMRLRSSVQVEIEKISGLFGMPTRTEIDSAHRKIVQLERAMRQRAREPGVKAAARRQPAPVVEPVRAPVPAAKAEKPKAAAKKPAKKASQQPKAGQAAKAASRKAAKKKAARRRPVPKQRKPAASAKPRGKAAPRRAVASRAVSPSKRAKTEVPLAKAKPATAVAPAFKAAKPAKGSVVSMRDWVARYAPPAPLGPEPSAKRNGKRGERK